MTFPDGHSSTEYLYPIVIPTHTILRKKSWPPCQLFFFRMCFFPHLSSFFCCVYVFVTCCVASGFGIR